ncbi:MAG TPA: hypothetical protein VHW46_07120 [Terracidiphilus sp.]|jgi:hypothetical protein|nr:hypothetical protein [Terracidiphilus sp.]
MKIVVAKRMSRRGEGLGNELLPWAKGWIASQVLDARLIGPSWGLNKRRYARNFRTGRLDWVLEDILLRLPHIPFTEENYRATGEIDFGKAVAKWADETGLKRHRSFVMSVEGMWGGYAAIHQARPFVWSQLLSSREALRNVYRVLSTLDRTKLFVAVHMRSGEGGFAQATPGASQRGQCNTLIPPAWALGVCGELTRHFRDRIQFWFFTDRLHPEFDEAVRRFNPAQGQQSGLTECSDLLLMALADLRVCAVSSYSLAASFLSDGPYLWYEPQLTLHDGLYSLWGNETSQRKPSSPTMRSGEFVRQADFSTTRFLGSAMDGGDSLPDSLAQLLEEKLRTKNPCTNLLDYGCLPRALAHSEKHPSPLHTALIGQSCQ